MVGTSVGSCRFIFQQRGVKIIVCALVSVHGVAPSHSNSPIYPPLYAFTFLSITLASFHGVNMIVSCSVVRLGRLIFFFSQKEIVLSETHSWHHIHIHTYSPTHDLCYLQPRLHTREHACTHARTHTHFLHYAHVCTISDKEHKKSDPRFSVPVFYIFSYKGRKRGSKNGDSKFTIAKNKWRTPFFNPCFLPLYEHDEDM